MAYEFEPACRRMEWLDPFYKQVWEKAYADAIPISGTFEITPRCNFNCRMCYVHLKEDEISKHGREMSAQEWIDLAKQAKDMGTTWLCITGGEPLMHPEFETIWKEISKMGFFITLQTNGARIPQFQSLFEEFPPRAIKITLYGTSNETYEKVCRIKNGFTLVHNGMMLLKQMHIPVELVSTIIQQNFDDMQKMAFYAYMMQVPWASTGGIRASLRGADTHVEELRVHDKNEESQKQQIKHYLEHPINIERKPCTYCKDYRLGYWITWDGYVRFCSFMNEPNISIHNQTFKDAWQQLVDYEDNLDWPDECKTCEVSSVCFKCAATLATNSGSVTQVNPSYCNKIKAYLKQVKEELQQEKQEQEIKQTNKQENEKRD